MTPSASTEPVATETLVARRNWLAPFQFSRLSGVYLWGGFVVLFAILAPNTFIAGTTARTIASGQSITAIVALGALVPLACGCFDISVAQVLGMSAVVCGALMANTHLAPAVAIIITIAIGLLVGAINGFLVAFVRVESLVATLGMSSVALAVTEAISKYQFVGPFPASFDSLTNGRVFGIPMVAVYALILAVVTWYVLEHTPIGRRVHATGAGSDAARLAGIRTKRYVFGSFVVAGCLASIAGILLASQISEVGPTAGPPYLLAAFAACFLSRTQIKPGRFNVFGTLVALILLGTGVEGLQLVGGPLWITDLFNGVALIVAVSAAVLSTRRHKVRKRGEVT